MISELKGKDVEKKEDQEVQIADQSHESQLDPSKSLLAQAQNHLGVDQNMLSVFGKKGESEQQQLMTSAEEK